MSFARALRYILSLSVCLSVCLYACMHSCMHVCKHACMNVCKCVCMRASVQACVYVCVYVCVRIISRKAPVLMILLQSRSCVHTCGVYMLNECTRSLGSTHARDMHTYHTQICRYT